MATNNIFCGICELRKLSRDPVVWCSDCDEALCIDCSEHHALSKLSRQHHTVPFGEYKTLPPFILNIKQFCDKHNERFQTFCKTHDCPCCRKCAVEKHKKCTDIVVLEDVIHHVKTSSKTQEVMTQLIEMTDNIKKIQMNRKNNAESLKKERKMIENEISETRRNVNDHLDRLQHKLMKELTDAEMKANSQIQEIITTLKKKEKEINEMKAGLDNIKRNASNLQAFLGMKQIESVAMETENYIQRLVESEHVTQTNLSCKMSDDIRKTISSFESYGEIIVDTKPGNVAIEVGKHKHAQMFVANILLKSVDNVTLKLDREVKHNITKIWGCCLLPNASMIFSSIGDRCLFLLNKDGSKDFTVDLRPGYPYGVTCIDNSNIAVAVRDSVRIINIDNRSVQRTIRDVGGKVSGITYKDGTLLCCVDKKGILSINLDNDTVTTVVSCPLSRYYSDVTTNNNNIYYTDHNTQTVTCCDMTGTTQWKFNDTSILTYPRGITVDRNGFIYVIESHNVVVISPDGKQYKEVLSTQDGLENPNVIHCDKSTNTLLVANYHRNAWLFNVE